MNKISLYIICLGMLLFMSSTPGMSKEYELEMIPKSKADICEEIFSNNDRYVVLSLDLGKVSVSDSLFGFTLYMQFDETKLYFDDKMTLNTLSEGFDGDVRLEKQGGNHILGNMGIVFGDINTPSAGDLPLVNLRFMYLGDCPDSAMVVLKELSFTSETKIPYFLNDTTYIYADVMEGEGRYAKVEYEDTLKTFTDEEILSNSIVFDLPEESRVNSLELTLDKIDSVLYNNFTSSNSGLVIEETIETDSNYVFKLSKTDLSDQYFIQYDIERVKTESFTETAKVAITSVNECNCVTEIYNHKQVLDYTKTGTAISETSKQELYEIAGDAILIKHTLNDIEVYDLSGNCKKYKDTDKISFDDMSAGMYFIIIKALNKIEKVRYLNIK